MNIYSLVLFLHIVGTLGSFVTLGLEWTSLLQVRTATTFEHVRLWMSISNGTRKLGMTSTLTIFITGLYLLLSAWSGVAWIIVTLGVMILMVVLINTLTRPQMMAIERAMAHETGPVSPTLQFLTNDPVLWISNQTRLAITLGIVFFMTIKPSLGGALLTIGIAVVLGLAFSLRKMRRQHLQEELVD